MSDSSHPRSPVPRSSVGAALAEAAHEARHRELAVEHLLFQALAYMERQHPGLLDHLDASVARLGDHAPEDVKDDEAVREVARLFVQSLRRTAAG